MQGISVRGQKAWWDLRALPNILSQITTHVWLHSNNPDKGKMKNWRERYKLGFNCCYIHIYIPKISAWPQSATEFLLNRATIQEAWNSLPSSIRIRRSWWPSKLTTLIGGRFYWKGFELDETAVLPWYTRLIRMWKSHAELEEAYVLGRKYWTVWTKKYSSYA